LGKEAWKISSILLDCSAVKFNSAFDFGSCHHFNLGCCGLWGGCPHAVVPVAARIRRTTWMIFDALMDRDSS
jgi:hypothetical protein